MIIQHVKVQIKGNYKPGMVIIQNLPIIQLYPSHTPQRVTSRVSFDRGVWFRDTAEEPVVVATEVEDVKGLVPEEVELVAF